MPLSAPAYTPPPFYAHPQSKFALAFFEAEDKATEYEILEPLDSGPDRRRRLEHVVDPSVPLT